MKPFQTHRQQLTILRGRGLIITNGSTAMRIFERENYYNVINGYKNLFLVKDQTGHAISPETYIPNTTIEEIYNLFTFDLELRNLFLKHLLIFENSIKSKIAYRFSEKFKEPLLTKGVLVLKLCYKKANAPSFLKAEVHR